jgi:dissimilatory sulfite reductase related protein
MHTNEQILSRLDEMAAQLGELTERQRARDELWDEAMPIAREALANAIVRFDALDKQGAFEALGDILDVARTLARPEVLQIARDVASALRAANSAQPMGALRAVRATRDPDVKRGIGLMIDVLRRVGHNIRVSDGHDAKALGHKEKLAELLGPRRARMLPAPRLAAPPVAPSTRSDAQLADPSTWTRAHAETIAREHGIELDGPRWALIEAARTDFDVMHASPNIQRLTQVAGVTTKNLYQLFPKAPARTIAKIAGLPKPAGCL